MLISFYAADWINRQGAAAAFDEMTAIEVASVLLAIPLFFWGRRLARCYGKLWTYEATS